MFFVLNVHAAAALFKAARTLHLSARPTGRDAAPANNDQLLPHGHPRPPGDLLSHRLLPNKHHHEQRRRESKELHHGATQRAIASLSAVAEWGSS